MFSPYWVFLCIGLLYWARFCTQEMLEYRCDSDKVITINNPNASLYIWAQVNASSYTCPVNMTGDKIVVTGCFNETLTMLLSNVNQIPTIVTSVIKSYRLSCLAIPPEGIVRKISNYSLSGRNLNISIETPVVAAFVVNTSITDAVTGLPKPVALIGETFLWYIDGPVQYQIVPENCTVYSGDMPDGTMFSVDTHLNGCTLDDGLVSDFRYINASRHVLVADVHTFRFPNSDQIRFVCTVRGCILNSTSLFCNFNCSDSRKKREASLRNMDELHSVNIPATPGSFPRATLTPPSSMSPKRSKGRTSSIGRGKIQVSLTVIGEPNIFIDRPTIFDVLSIGTSSSQSGAVVLMILVMLKLMSYLFY